MLPLSTLLSLSRFVRELLHLVSSPFLPGIRIHGGSCLRQNHGATNHGSPVFQNSPRPDTSVGFRFWRLSLSLSVYLSFVCSIDPLPLPAQREYRLTPASIVDDWKYAISTSGKLIKGSPTQLLGRIISHPRRVRMRAEREIESFEDFRRFRGIFFFVRNKVKARVLVHSFLTTHTFLRFSCRKS